MKKIILVFAVIIFSVRGFSQVPNWLWVKSAGGTSSDAGISIATDASGNVYATGAFFSPSVTFGTITLTNAGAPTDDMFIVKYDASGNVLWASSAGGTSNEEGYSVMVDVSGNVYVMGGFNGTAITFGTDTLTGAGTWDMFIVKYDAVGNVLWAKSAGGINMDWGGSIALDALGNVYVTGAFHNTVTFGTTVLTNVDPFDYDIFIVKYDISGNVLWAKSASGIDNDYGDRIVTDALGNAYMTGKFDSPSLIFGTDTLTNANQGYYDIFIAKYDSSGNVLWAKSSGGMSSEYVIGITEDGLGNIYTTGKFESPIVTFGTDTLTNVGFYSDIFIAKYDGSGNVVWAESFGGISLDEGNSIASDAAGNVYVTGSFYSPTISFGSNTLTNISNLGYADFFITKFDASGNVLWANSAGGTSNDLGYGVDEDALGNIYVTGGYGTTVIFGADTLTAVGSSTDFFIAKLGMPIGINEWRDEETISLFPNPATNELTIENSRLKTKKVEIYSSVGEKIFEKHLSSDIRHLSISVADFPPGIYFITVTDQAGNKVTKKVVKM